MRSGSSCVAARCFDMPANLLAPSLKRFEHQRVLGAKQIVDRRLGQPGVAGDALGCHRVQSLAVEELAGGIHQPLSIRGMAGHQKSELDRVYRPVNNFTIQ